MNLYEIEQDLLQQMAVLEEQDGEFTEEQLRQLECTQEDFKSKLEGYYHYLQTIKNDVDQCKLESKRITDIRKVKENKIERIESLMLDAVIKFGNLQKNGVSSIEYPTFKLSTRKSTVIELNESRSKDLIYYLRKYFEEADVSGVLTFENTFSAEGIIASINANYTADKQFDGFDVHEIVPFTIDDLLMLEVNIVKRCKFVDLFTNSYHIDLLKAIASDPTIEIESNISKTNCKELINNNVSITLAEQKNNISLQTK